MSDTDLVQKRNHRELIFCFMIFTYPNLMQMNSVNIFMFSQMFFLFGETFVNKEQGIYSWIITNFTI